MKIHASCSLCSRFEPNREHCTYYDEPAKGMDQKRPASCKERGVFVRDLNVLLDSYHLYGEREQVPADFKIDFSRLPKDEHGTPLFVLTKRGIERAIPAYPGIKLKGDMLLGVPKVTTYQGQRELIRDLGTKLAKEIAAGRGVELKILEGEHHEPGKPEEIRRHNIYRQRQQAPNPWMKSADEGEW